jgi:uncharacterized protein DUF4235
MLKMLDKPLGLLISVAGGIAAGAVFNRVWTLTTGQDDAPEATDPDRSWREVLVAASVQGAVFGLVKAAGTGVEPPVSANHRDMARQMILFHRWVAGTA